MSTFKSLLEETIESWQDVRTGIIYEVENIPEQNFDFKPTPDVRSVKDLIVHILEVAMMMTGELTRPDTNFHRASWPELLNMYASEAYQLSTKAELVAMLQSQLEDAKKKFQEAGELHMFQLIKRFDGQQGTRFAWLQHGIAQEMYHRGQLTLYQRMMGIEPALTRKIRNFT